jgi:hypothetical protein
MAVRIRRVPPPLREGSAGQLGILVRLVVLAVLGLVALVISSAAG